MVSKKSASLAQLVEHDTCNIVVVGSSPTGGSKRYQLVIINKIYCGVEQR